MNHDDSAMIVRLYNAPKDFPLIAEPAKFQATQVEPEKDAQAQFEIPKPPGEKWQPENLRRQVYYQRYYRLNAIEDNERMFPAWSRRRGGRTTVAQLLRVAESNGRPLFDSLQRQRFVFAAGIDLSGIKRTGTVVWTVAKEIATQKIFPVEVHRGKDLDAHSIVKLLQEQSRRGVVFTKVRVESNATQSLMQREVAIAAKREQVPWWGVIEGFQTGENKLSESGLPLVNTLLDSGQIEWADAEADRHEAWRLHGEEMASCPRVPDRGKTPDSPMAFWFAAEFLYANTPVLDPADFRSF